MLSVACRVEATPLLLRLPAIRVAAQPGRRTNAGFPYLCKIIAVVGTPFPDATKAISASLT